LQLQCILPYHSIRSLLSMEAGMKGFKARRARRLASIPGGIRRHHRQMQINEQLKTI